jgi:adenylate kinase
MSFSGLGSSRAKVILPDPSLLGNCDLAASLRSLNCEHIALGACAESHSLGVPRNILAAPATRQASLEAVRRWFFLRRPDAGFILTGFPATLFEAQAFSEWLEARGETLDVSLFSHDACSEPLASLVRYYQALALAWFTSSGSVLPEWLCAPSEP